MAVIETIKTKAGVVLSSFSDLNSLTIDKIEEIAQINTSSASYFSAVGIKQLRAVSTVKDIESLRKFTADSISLSGEIVKKVLDDGKTWMAVGGDLKDKITEIFSPKEEMAAKKKSAAKAVA